MCLFTVISRAHLLTNNDVTLLSIFIDCSSILASGSRLHDTGACAMQEVWTACKLLINPCADTLGFLFVSLAALLTQIVFETNWRSNKLIEYAI